MSFANELQKLKNLRDSGAMTREEYEASRNRLLEECVRRIESVHDRPAKHSQLASPPPTAMKASGPANSPTSESEPRVKFPSVDAAARRSSTYSQELDYSLVKPPASRGYVSTNSSATAYALAKTGVESVPAPNREEPAVSPQPGIPRVKFSAPPPFEEPTRSHQPAPPVDDFRNADTAVAPAPIPSVRVAYETVKINPAAPRVDAPQHSVASDVSAHRPEVSAPPPAEDLSHSPLKLPAPSVTAFHVESRLTQAPLRTSPVAPRLDPDTETHRAPVSSPGETCAPPQSDEVATVEEFLPRFAAAYDTEPAERNRWGLPRFKLVSGVVQDVRLLLCPDSEAYAAMINVDGQRMEISASSEICISAGDRVSLGGYERDGQLLVLGYRNETNGSHSDLNRLRKRYRFLLTVGRLILLAGLAAVAATVMLTLRKPVWASHFDQWGYLPYVLSGLTAAAVSYLGLALSSVGKWAKEFHNALAPTGPSLLTENSPSALPATY